MTAYRFVHAADIHLHSPLRSLALRHQELADLIGNATRRALVRIVDLCVEERVDALLLAGDLYDGDQTSMKTARFLAEQIRRLDEAGVRSFIIRGNHDALSRITKELTFPASVKVFGARAEAVEIERPAGDVPIAVHGLSFAQPHAPESLVGRYRPPVEGAVNIGLMHTSLGGAPGHDLYAPCSVADLQATGFRYWALGHIHQRAVVEGDCTIVMPGMPQGRDINEAGVKSVTLVTVGDDRSVRVEERITSIAQFERIGVDVSGIAEWGRLVAHLGAAVERQRHGLASEYLVARLHLTGATPLAWRIRRDLDLLKTELDDRASAIGSCWIEKLDIDCRAAGAAVAGAADDPLAELRRLIDEDVAGSEAFRQEAAAIVEELSVQLPAECRNCLGAGEADFHDAIPQWIREGADEVMARLRDGAGAT